jgi:integrase
MLSRDLACYIDQKRSLGFKFHNQNVLLRGFVRFAEERGDRYITSARVLAWAAGAPSPEHRRTRLLTVRRFALALHAENARHQIPQADALGRATSKRRPPYIYRSDEIVRLLRTAAALEPPGSIRPILYMTLLGLIAATGMRIAEALALQLDDVTADGLVIRETKFQKSRLLPLHATVRQALDRYLIDRRKVSLSPLVAGRYPITPYAMSSSSSSIAPASGVCTEGATRASTICATPSRSARWSSAVTIATGSPVTSWHSAPISATRM